jgi:hypothetical protein
MRPPILHGLHEIIELKSDGQSRLLIYDYILEQRFVVAVTLRLRGCLCLFFKFSLPFLCSTTLFNIQLFYILALATMESILCK